MFREALIEGKKPKITKEMKKIFDEMDKLLDLDNVKLKGAEADLVRPHKDTREKGKNGRPMKEVTEVNEGADFKQQFKEKIAEFKHIDKFGDFSDKPRKEGTVSISGTLLNGKKVINIMEFKGISKEQKEKLVALMNKRLPILNKELGSFGKEK